MKPNNVVKIVKIGGLILNIAGTIATGWAGSKENEKVLEKLVEKRLNK